MSRVLDQRILDLLDQAASPYSAHDIAVQLGVPDDDVEPSVANLSAWGAITSIEYEDDVIVYCRTVAAP